MSQTSASTTITFAIAGGSGNSISVELDDAANGSKSTFLPGDTVYFLVHSNPVDLSISIDTTLGTVTANGTKSVAVSEQLQFVQSAEATLGKVPSGTVTTAWVGRAGGAPSISCTSVTLPLATNGILSCDYSTTAKSYRLSGVTIPSGLDEIQVLVVVTPAA